MDIIGASYGADGICFAKKDSKISTNSLYINEFINLFRNNGICDIGFSYNVIGDKIVQVWSPADLQYTMAGKVMKKVDDYLKIILNELSPIYNGEKYINLIKNKTELPANMSIGGEQILTGISIEPSQIIVNKTTNTIEIIDINLKLNYWRKNYVTGVAIPFTQFETAFLNNYVQEDIPNLCRIDPSHPFNHLKKVFVAQHIAKFLVANTKISVAGLMRTENPDLGIPIHLINRETEEIVFGYNNLVIKKIGSKICHEFKYDGTGVKYNKLETPMPTSNLMSKITALHSEGGVKSESSDSKYIQRGLVENKSGPRFSYVVFNDDSKKCKELKIMYNSAMLNMDSFFSDAINITQLAIDSYKNYDVIKNYPERIVKYCTPR